MDSPISTEEHDIRKKHNGKFDTSSTDENK
jgi:hypothetical protein